MTGDGKQLVSYDEKWAEQAAAAAAEEPAASGSFFSTRAGVLKLGDEEMPGNQVCVVIVDAVFENTYYEGRFNADDLKPPVCYAFGRGGEDMAPHPAMQDHPYFVPQHEECNGCPHNEWGSADQGRSKACQNRRRLAMIPAGYFEPKGKGSKDYDLHLFDDPAHYAAADIANLKLPVTSVKNWSKYVTTLAAAERRPPHGVITRVWIVPDEKYQYIVHFEMVEKVPDELADAIMARHEAAAATPFQPYAGPREEDTAPKGSLKGLRR